MTVETRWVDGSGYRPVRITVTPKGTTTADKTLTVEMLYRRNWAGDYDLSVRRDLDLPAGSGPANPVQVTLSVPACPGLTSYAINVLEDGTLRPGLSTPWTPMKKPVSEWTECFPAMLVVGDALPDISQLAAPLPIRNYLANQPTRFFRQGLSNFRQGPAGWPNLTQAIGQLPNVVARTTTELPQRWIDYSSLDVVCLSLAQLQQLAESHPARLRAMVEWIATGGNLWVYGVGWDWQHIGDLEGLVGLPPGADGAGASTAPSERGWTEPDPTRYGRPIRGTLSDSTMVDGDYVEALASEVGWEEIVAASSLLSDPASPPEGVAPEDPHFLLREYEMGLIVAFGEDPFPGTKADWSWVLGEMGAERWAWYQRHGLSTLRENRDYWEFLIPGVGLAPVTEFCVLITLFVVAIGPVNYWLLRRWQRLYLLVVTTPLSAAMITGLLVAYALVDDGLGTRVRVRSLTRLDERRGQATCWARLSYYAGLAPGGGLTFPDDVVVLPLEHLPMPGYREAPLRRELIWGQTDQWLASGWLPSRTPVQFLTVRSRGADFSLVLDAEKLQVENRLGTHIRQLAARPFDGQYYWAAALDEGASVRLEPIQRSEAFRRLSATRRDHAPALPEGMQRGYYGGALGRPSGYSATRRYANSAITLPSQATSRLEMGLEKLGEPELGPAARDTRWMLPPGSYVAIVDRSPEVDLGTAATEDASYHVIVGKW